MKSPESGGVKWFPLYCCGLLWLIQRLMNRKRIRREIRPSRLGRVPFLVMCVAKRDEVLSCVPRY
jgi:hypothetical protein